MNRRLPEDLKRYARYKWEFLRRRTSYRQAWEKLQIVLNERYGEEERSAGLLEEEIQFLLRWHVVPINPDNSFDSILDGSCRLPTSRVEIILYSLYPPNQPRPVTVTKRITSRDNKPFPDMDYIADIHGIGLWVDLRYSRYRLKREFGSIVDYWFEQHRVACNNRGFEYEQPAIRRPHYENFDMYLKAYDLRKERKSLRRIQILLHLNSDQTARNYVNAARDLVKRGID